MVMLVVPFGLPSEDPVAGRPVIRGVWPGIGPEDWIVLWGGGLWDWLDPLTLIRAVDASLRTSAVLRAEPLGGVVDTFEPDTQLYGARQFFSIWFDT